jgi:hypothetical protein
MQLSWPGNYEAIRAKVAPCRVATALPARRQRGKLRGDPREGRAMPRRRRIASAPSRCAGWLQVGSVDLCSDPDAVCSDAKVAAASRPFDVF